MFKFRMQNLSEFKSVLVDDSKPTHKSNVEVMGILIINM